MARTRSTGPPGNTPHLDLSKPTRNKPPAKRATKPNVRKALPADTENEDDDEANVKKPPPKKAATKKPGRKPSKKKAEEAPQIEDEDVVESPNRDVNMSDTETQPQGVAPRPLPRKKAAPSANKEPQNPDDLFIINRRKEIGQSQVQPQNAPTPRPTSPPPPDPVPPLPTSPPRQDPLPTCPTSPPPQDPLPPSPDSPPPVDDPQNLFSPQPTRRTTARPIQIHEEEDMDEEMEEDTIRYSTKSKGKAKQSNGDYEDEEDEEEDEEDANDHSSKSKRKSKESNDNDDNDDNAGPYHKPGPISDAAKERAFAAQERYHEEMRQIARDERKPVHTIFRLVDAHENLRETSTWNVFQAWWGVEGPGKGKGKSKEMSRTEYTRFLRGEYIEYLKEKLGDESDNKEAKAKLFEPILEWYHQKFLDHVEERRVKGSFSLIIRKVVDSLEKLGLRYHEMYGLHCGGVVVNVDPDVHGKTGSVLWGSTPQFDKMKKGEVAFINRQVSQWVSYITLQVAEAEGGEVDETQLLRPDIDRRAHEGERDYERRAFLNILRADYGICFSFFDYLRLIVPAGQARYKNDTPLNECKDLKIPWQTWPDEAYENKVRISGWPLDGNKPGAGFKFKSTTQGLPHNFQKDTVYNYKKSSGEDGKKNHISIELWDADELALDPDDAGHVALVKDVNGRTVVSVADAPKYIKRNRGRVKQTAKEKRISRHVRRLADAAPANEAGPSNPHAQDNTTLDEGDVEDTLPRTKSKKSRPREDDDDEDHHPKKKKKGLDTTARDVLTNALNKLLSDPKKLKKLLINSSDGLSESEEESDSGDDD
ncbi:hypothetical protein H0H93_001458 [Arthromyces matolae]|nr:hypothetical protein H0H93_001458 [Arthromyces matolae]